LNYYLSTLFNIKIIFMKLINVLKVTSIFILFSCLLCSCGDEEEKEVQLEEWEVEVERLKSITSQYADFQYAVDQGLIDVSGYVPNMGHHYLDPSISDSVFDIDQPEIILYLPDSNGDMQMVAVEYSIIPEDSEDPGSPPEGFTGDLDVWHFNENLGQWQLHVWIVMENPDGIFASFNPAIGD
jgi:hypothetical protein